MRVKSDMLQLECRWCSDTKAARRASRDEPGVSIAGALSFLDIRMSNSCFCSGERPVPIHYAYATVGYPVSSVAFGVSQSFL